MSDQNLKSKTELFRFATIRKPKLIGSEIRKIGFVFNSNPDSSHFFSELKNAKTLEEARDNLPKLANSFDRIQRVEEIRQLNEKVFRFSSWLMQHRSYLRQNAVADAQKGVSQLTNVQRTQLWDNLYADLVTKDSPSMRHTCIQMLVADHFIRYADSKEGLRDFSRQSGVGAQDKMKPIDAYLRRLAHASVAVHYVFGATREEVAEDFEDDRFPKFLGEEKSRFLTQEDIIDLETLSADVFELSARFDNEKLVIKQQAETAHKTEVEKEKNKFRKDNKLQGKTLAELRKIDPDTLPDLELPELKYRFPNPMSEDYFGEKVREGAVPFLQAKAKEGKDLDGAVRDLQDRLSQARKKLYRQGKGSKKRVRLAGKVYGIRESRDYIFTLGFRPDLANDEEKDAIYLIFFPGNPSLFVRSLEYGLKLGGAAEGKSKQFRERNRSNKAILIRLFPAKSIAVEPGTVFRFRADLELSNGQKFELELESQKGLEATWGQARLVQTGIRESTINLPFEKVDVYGVNHIGIADYRLVEQEVCCYIPSEVSHIENILAREYKERHTRSLTSTETTTEGETVYESENQTDTATTERNEMNTEIASILAEEKSNSSGVSTGVSGSYFGVETSLDAGIDFVTSNSSSDSNTLAKNYAVEVTKAATERVLQKITEKRISRMLQEYEENNRHGFDNRDGDQHVTGVYRWLDKVMTNRLVNYGKRLIYEFMVPEPSKFYREAIEIQSEEEETSSSAPVLEEPVHPSKLETPISSADDIDRDNYKEVAAHYGVSPEAPKQASDFVDANYSKGNLDKKEYGEAQMPPVTIPTDYVAIKTTGTLTYDWEAKPPINDGGAYINVSFGGETYRSGTKEGKRTRTTIPNTFSIGGQTFDTPGLEFDHGERTGSMTCSVSCNKLFSFNISLAVEIKLRDDVYEQWKLDTYAEIMEAYEQKKAAYDASLQQAEAAASDDEKQHMEIAASMYRQVEQTELKRLAIEMLTAPFGIRQGRDFTGTTNCGIPKVIQNENLDRYSATVKFFEQAFDWSIMSYIFYPYYWAKKCDWVELFQAQTGTDEIFSAFLQSGMARMTVPVRRGFEKAVIYYMATGEIWMGGDLVLESDDDLYLSIAEELEVPEGRVEEEWESVLPTSLTIVQKDSAGLNTGGLPCCDDVDVVSMGLVSSDNKLKRLDTPTEDADGN